MAIQYSPSGPCGPQVAYPAQEGLPPVPVPPSNCSITVPNDHPPSSNVTSADCTAFNFILWGVVGSSFCVLGMIGNALSFTSFHKDRRTPAVTLLQCLACSDFLLLLTVFITDGIPYACDYSPGCRNFWFTWPYIRYIWLLTPMSHMCSIWFVVLIAMNRYWAVCKPHHMSRFWAPQRTATYVIAVIMLVLVFNLPRFFEYNMEHVYNLDTNQTEVKENRTSMGFSYSYKVIYKVYLVNLLLIMLPLVTLALLTCPILRAIHMRSKGDVHKKPSSLSKASQEITFVLSLVLVVTIICQTPISIFHFVRYSYKYSCGDFVFYLDNISKILITLNSCINFVIYCLFSARFRRLLLATVSCQGRGFLAQIEPYSTRREFSMSYLRG